MIRASHILFWLSLSIVASGALYHTSDRTRELDRQLRSINTAIEAEQQKIHVLKAEWVYLANPARVEATAKKFLGLQPTKTKQVIAYADLEENLPIVAEVKPATVTASATGVAMPSKPIQAAQAAPTAKPSPPHAPVRTASLKSKPHRVSHKARKVAVVAAAHEPSHNRVAAHDTAATQPNDSIGALIAQIGAHP